MSPFALQARFRFPTTPLFQPLGKGVSRSRPGVIAGFAILAALLAGCGRYTARHLARGDQYFKRQLDREAIAEYTLAVRFAPDHPQGIRHLGLAHHRLGEWREA